MMPVKEKIKTAHNGISIPFDAWDYTIETIKFFKEDSKKQAAIPENQKIEFTQANYPLPLGLFNKWKNQVDPPEPR